jgi:hypothetical protein
MPRLVWRVLLSGKKNLNPSITTPSQFAGHEIGDLHLTHDKLYYYMLELDRLSDRALWEEYEKATKAGR